MSVVGLPRPSSLRSLSRHLLRRRTASAVVQQWRPVSSSGFNNQSGIMTSSRSTDPSSIQTVFSEIHTSLDHGDKESSQLTDIATYYFDGQGKVTRPVLTMLMAKALNDHLGLAANPRLASDQRKIALAAEMYHTASLMHDDVIDHAEMRRGKESVNQLWGQLGSIRAGDYSVAIATKEVAEMKQTEVRNVCPSCVCF